MQVGGCAHTEKSIQYTLLEISVLGSEVVISSICIICSHTIGKNTGQSHVVFKSSALPLELKVPYRNYD